MVFFLLLFLLTALSALPALPALAEEETLAPPTDAALEEHFREGGLFGEEEFFGDIEEPRRAPVRVYGREGFLPLEIADGFRESLGREIRYESYPTTDVLEERLRAPLSDYDVIILPAAFLEGLIQAGRLRLLEKGRFSHYGNLSPIFLEKLLPMDPDNSHAIPYLWGSVGLLYDAAMVRRAARGLKPSSWAVLFDPKNAQALSPCGLALPDRPSEVLAAARLFWDAAAAGRLDAGRLDAAAESGEEQPRPRRPRRSRSRRAAADPSDPSRDWDRLSAVMPFIETVAPPADILYGGFCLTMGGQAEIFEILQEGKALDPPKRLRFRRPSEGSPMWMDVMVMPAAADSSSAADSFSDDAAPAAALADPAPASDDAAYLFMDYMLRADAGATLATLTGYASPNKAARAGIDEEMRASATLNPPDRSLEGLRIERGASDLARRSLTRAWRSLTRGKRRGEEDPLPLPASDSRALSAR